MLLLAAFLVLSCRQPETTLEEEQPPQPEAPVVLEPIEDIDAWFLEFRKQPDPDRVPMAIELLIEKGYFTKASHVTIGFLSQVFRMYPECVAAWATPWPELAESDQKVLVGAIWTSNIEDTQAILQSWLPMASEELQQTIQACIDRPAIDILEAPLDPSVLDALWAGYFATGKPEFLTRLVDALEIPHEEEDGMGNLMTYGAARWSIASNAEQHADVLDVLKAMTAEAEGLRKSELVEVVRSVEE